MHRAFPGEQEKNNLFSYQRLKIKYSVLTLDIFETMRFLNSVF